MGKGQTTLKKRNSVENQPVYWGLGGLFVVLALCLVLLVLMVANQDRQSVQYPGAVPLSNHSNYGGLPYRFHWDNSYSTRDPFTAVYNWYSTKFNLGAEVRANGGCILLEGASKQLTVKRHMSVLLCDTPTERLIYVSRFTALK